MAGDRAGWAKTRIVASIWWCGDDYCNCTQPIIERVTPNTVAGYPWIRRERLWEGTFQANDVERIGPGQDAELDEAIVRFRSAAHWEMLAWLNSFPPRMRDYRAVMNGGWL